MTSTRGTDMTTSAQGNTQPKAKILMSKNIKFFVEQIFNPRTLSQDYDQAAFASCCNPLVDFSKYTDKDETWLNKFLGSFNLRTPNTFGSFSQDFQSTDDSAIKISHFLEK